MFLYAYFSIDAEFLAQGAVPNDDFFYLPLDKIYIAILLISFFYYTFYTAYLTKTPLYEQKSSDFLSIGWFIDSILIFSFLAYCVVVNYITYYNSVSWKTSSIFKSFLLNN
ncbi:MAG: hypothetical protein N4Q32_00815 [Neisseriaceae bacterium]|nr:hypothetical protein [Neisseriaceae bacterium]